MDFNFYYSYFFLFGALGLFYVFFRISMGILLRRKKCSNVFVKKNMHGKSNYWWYKSIHHQVGIGIIYHLNKLFTAGFMFCVLLHIVIGWCVPINVLVSVILGGLCIVGAIMYCILLHDMVLCTNTKKQNEPSHLSSVVLGIIFPLWILYSIVSYYVK